ncbi:MAG TPA: FtsK/SpoIIIE N-terminal domain-containing protein, partial [Chondromyces sp.]|nr:FtsK/SpoIIIE N-terminal domain-containing protein [Chondromyces sp.]
MNRLWIFYNETYQQCPVLEDGNQVITIGGDKNYTVYFHSYPSNQMLKLKKTENALEYMIFQENDQIGTLQPGRPFTMTAGSHLLSLHWPEQPVEERLYYVGQKQQISLSGEEDSDIKRKNPVVSELSDTAFSFLRNEREWLLVPGSKGIYLNGKKVYSPIALMNGDIVCWPFMELAFREKGLLFVRSYESYSSSLLETSEPFSEMKQKYPVYRRTPRMIYELPEEKMTISFPSQEGEGGVRSLWLIILPPLMMLLVMGMIALIQPRGLFILISVVMFTTTLITSTVQYVKDKKERKERKMKRRKIYTRYLEKKREELHELAEKQEAVLQFHYPSFEEMKEQAFEISSRIWERTVGSRDFLHVRIGRSDVPSSYEVSLGSQELANRDIDDLLEQ